MTKKELQALRVLIDRARREQLLLPQRGAEEWHGTETGYSAKKCRCDECRGAATRGRRKRYQLQYDRDPEFREKEQLRAQKKREKYAKERAQSRAREARRRAKYHTDPEAREKRLEQGRRYRARKRDEINARRRESWNQNEAVKKTHDRWRRKNIERVNALRREWRHKHRDRENAIRLERRRAEANQVGSKSG